MAAKDAEKVLDVQSVVEAVVADEDADVPRYEVESLCMRCHENVFVYFFLSFSRNFCPYDFEILFLFSAAFSGLIRDLICDCLFF